MGNKILHKKSDVSGNTPPLNVLSAGEIAINTADGFLFFKKNAESGDYVSKFVDIEGQAHVLNISLSSFVPQFGGNTVSEVFGSVLGGYSNDVSGAASTTINGENNDIDSDFSLIGNGENNKISIGADYSFIAAGQNNLVSHSNVFTLGSNLSSHASDFTYVNNLSSVGKIYGDGSELTGIVAGDTEATNLVRSNSASWESVPINVILNFDPLKFVFVGDGSTTTYSISGTNDSTNAATIEVFVNNVRQEPEVSYSLSSEIVEFTQAPILDSRIVIITPNVAEVYGGGNEDIEATTLVRSNSANWDSTYTTVQTNSASWGAGISQETQDELNSTAFVYSIIL